MDRSIQPITKGIKEFELAIPQRSTLSNGIPLTVINAGEQEVVRLDIIFEGGRWRQSHKLQSVFANRMLKEGTKKYKSSEIAEKLDYYGAWLELSCSASHEFITLYSLNKYFESTLSLIESIIKEPLFPQNELNIVMNANIQQYLINSSKVDFQCHRKLLNVLYGEKHPCGSPVTEIDYRNLTRNQLESFYHEFYNSNNCSIFISGKITDDILRCIENHFGNASFGKLKPASSLKDFPITISPAKSFQIYQ